MDAAFILEKSNLDSSGQTKIFKTSLHITEQQRGQVPGRPGGALLQSAQRQEAGADDQVHQVPDPVQS